MITRVTIENFQSHVRTELELSPAVTVLTGESDVGKSAAIRALRWLFYNEPRGANFVRRGASTCRVAVEYEDGTTLARERSAAANRYIVRRPGGSEEIYEGFGSDIPLEVSELAGMRRLEVNGVSLAPNFSGQMDPPFLLGETGSTAAAALGLLSRADVFDAALRSALADKGRAERAARAAAEDVAAIGRELERYADLPAWENALGRAAGLLAAVREAGARKEALASLIAQSEATKAALRRAAGLLAAGRGLGWAAELAAGAGELAARRDRLAALSGEWFRTDGRLAALGVLWRAADTAAEADAPVEKAGASERRLVELSRLVAERRAGKQALARAAAVASAAAGADDAANWLGEAARDAACAVRLAALAGERGILADKIKRAAEICAVSEYAVSAGAALEDCPTLCRTKERLAAAASRRAKAADARRVASDSKARTEEELKRAAAELAEELRAAGRCPVCFNPIQAGDVREIVSKLAG